MHAFGTSTEWYCQPSAAWCRYIDNVGHETSHQKNTPVTDNPLSYSGYRFPPDVISYAMWLSYRFPPSLRMVEELLVTRGIELTYENVRRWAAKFGLGIARVSGPQPRRAATSGTLMKWSSRLL
jgi:transposase-like protein